MVQQNEESKREPESDIEGVAEMTSRTHQPPALPPRPPPRPARRYEATSVNQCELFMDFSLDNIKLFQLIL